MNFTGDDLQPNEISEAFSLTPTIAHAAGDQILGENGEVRRLAKIGRWSLRLKRAETDEWDVTEVIRELIGRFPTDDAAWAKVPANAKLRVSVGLNLATSNQGLSVEPDVSAWLGRRGANLDLDIYRDDEDE